MKREEESMGYRHDGSIRDVCYFINEYLHSDKEFALEHYSFEDYLSEVNFPIMVVSLETLHEKGLFQVQEFVYDCIVDERADISFWELFYEDALSHMYFGCLVHQFLFVTNDYPSMEEYERRLFHQYIASQAESDGSELVVRYLGE